MRKILIATADRSERGLLEPVFNELSKNKDLAPIWCELNSKYAPTLNIGILGDMLDFQKPDIVIIPCDRNEMVYAAAYAFQKGYVIAHFHAGNNLTNHTDDFNRRAISLYSHIMLCNMKEHKQNLIKAGEEEWRIHVVGTTALDIELDTSITPKQPYNLVILHPTPDSEEQTRSDLSSTIAEVLHDNNITFWIYPNQDKNHEIIEQYIETHLPGIIKIKNLPRAQYLSLLKNCSRAIGNSSSFYYELPLLQCNPRLVPIGARNKNLVVPQTEIGGSKRIANILATIELTDTLRKKRMT